MSDSDKKVDPTKLFAEVEKGKTLKAVHFRVGSICFFRRTRKPLPRLKLKKKQPERQLT